MSININPAHKGLLHKKMGIAQSKPISTKSLEKKGKHASGKLKKEIVFAENARKWHHSKKPAEVSTDRGNFGMK